jgi:hypothetical protein
MAAGTEACWCEGDLRAVPQRAGLRVCRIGVIAGAGPQMSRHVESILRYRIAEAEIIDSDTVLRWSTVRFRLASPSKLLNRNSKRCTPQAWRRIVSTQGAAPRTYLDAISGNLAACRQVVEWIREREEVIAQETKELPM